MRYLRNPFDEAECAEVGKACATRNEEPSLTKQSFARDADLNELVRRFGITKVPVGSFDPSHYGDFTGAPDLREALEIMRDAQEQFEALPSRVRNRFQNDPALLFEFVQDPANREEGEFLGIFERPRPGAGGGGIPPSPGAVSASSEEPAPQSSEAP